MPASASRPQGEGGESGGSGRSLAGRRALLLAGALALVTPAGVPADAEPGGPAAGEATRGAEWRLGVRLGALVSVNASESYDAVYGDPLPQPGVSVEVELRRWLLALSFASGDVDGEQVLPTDPPTPTGVDSTLTYRPLALTGAYVFTPDRAWRWYAGLGATLLDWEEEGATRNAGGSELGGHLAAGFRRGVGRRWSLGGELRWSTVPDAVGGAGVSQAFGEDDLGGVAVDLVVLYRLGGP